MAWPLLSNSTDRSERDDEAAPTWKPTNPIREWRRRRELQVRAFRADFWRRAVLTRDKAIPFPGHGRPRGLPRPMAKARRHRESRRTPITVSAFSPQRPRRPEGPKASRFDPLGSDRGGRGFADCDLMIPRRNAAPLNVAGLAQGQHGSHVVGVQWVGKEGGRVFAEASRSGRIALGATAGRNKTGGGMAVAAGFAGKKVCKFLRCGFFTGNYRLLHGSPFIRFQYI